MCRRNCRPPFLKVVEADPLEAKRIEAVIATADAAVSECSTRVPVRNAERVIVAIAPKTSRPVLGLRLGGGIGLDLIHSGEEFGAQLSLLHVRQVDFAQDGPIRCELLEALVAVVELDLSPGTLVEALCTSQRCLFNIKIKELGDDREEEMESVLSFCFPEARGRSSRVRR